MEEIINIYKAFASEMEQWEIKAYNGVAKENKNMSLFQEEFNGIIDKYCKPKKTPYEREHKTSAGFPPAYSTAHKIIDVEIDNKKAFITIEEVTGFNNKVRFTLNFYKKQWRFTKKEWFVQSENRWSKALL